jgi:hypothetical protein
MSKVIIFISQQSHNIDVTVPTNPTLTSIFVKKNKIKNQTFNWNCQVIALLDSYDI